MRRFAAFRNLRGLGGRPQAPGGPGPKPWGPGPQAPWRPGPQAPAAWIPPLAEFLTSCCVLKSWAGLRTLGCHHNPQSADLGGRWMVSEGGALQSHENGVPVFAPAFQPLGRAPSPENLANKPLSPASRQPSRIKNSKNAPVLIGS